MGYFKYWRAITLVVPFTGSVGWGYKSSMPDQDDEHVEEGGPSRDGCELVPLSPRFWLLVVLCGYQYAEEFRSPVEEGCCGWSYPECERWGDRLTETVVAAPKFLDRQRSCIIYPTAVSESYSLFSKFILGPFDWFQRSKYTFLASTCSILLNANST